MLLAEPPRNEIRSQNCRSKCRPSIFDIRFPFSIAHGYDRKRLSSRVESPTSSIVQYFISDTSKHSNGSAPFWLPEGMAHAEHGKVSSNLETS